MNSLNNEFCEYNYSYTVTENFPSYTKGECIQSCYDKFDKTQQTLRENCINSCNNQKYKP